MTRDREAVRENAHFWRVPTLGDLELLKATFVTQAFAPHTHEGFALGVIEAGVEGFRHRGAHSFAASGSLILINPDEMHTGYAVDGFWVYRMLYPGATLMQEAASEVLGRPAAVPFFPAVAPHDDPMARLILGLHRALETGTSELEQRSRLLWTLGYLIARHADTRALLRPVALEHRAVAAARSYLRERHQENVRLDDLAALTGLSPFHLLRVFRAQVGLPPHAYLNQIRVERARSLLREGKSLGDAALEVGFADQSHLTRHFKRLVGVPPGAYAHASVR